MLALQTGTVLLRKYRVDSLRVAGGEVDLYDATDTIHARHVCIKVFRRDERFVRDAHGPNVFDIGRNAGFAYVVVGDPGTPTPRRAPPPLPARAKKKKSVPPPLPPRAECVTIPTEAMWTCDPTIVDDLALDVAAMRPGPSRLAWVAILVVAVFTGVGGWYATTQRLVAEPASAPPSIETQSPVAEPAPSEPAPAEPTASTSKTVPAAPPTPPHRKPLVDPLTL